MNVISQLNRFNKSRHIAQVCRILVGTFVYLSVSWVTLNTILPVYAVVIISFFTLVFVGFIFMEAKSFKNGFNGEMEPHNLWLPITAVFILVLFLYISFGEYGAEVEEFIARAPVIILRFLVPSAWL